MLKNEEATPPAPAPAPAPGAEATQAKNFAENR